jgi:hypothetical protein
MSQKELNMWKMRWVELIKDHDCIVDYHPVKANIVADVISRKGKAILSNMEEQGWDDQAELKKMNLQLTVGQEGSLLA